MGGHYQAAGHAYVLTQMIDFGLSPQEALDLPRVFPNSNVLDFEKNFDNSIIEDMASRGHEVNYPVSPIGCLLYTSPSPRDRTRSRMPSSA